MGVERPAIGRVIGGKYRIERPLGAGAWAQVFLAEHVDLHSKVAIKILSNWESCGEKQLGRFLREARAVVRLKTIHVCRVLDVGRTEEGAPFTVLEHLDGTDFQHVVEERGRLDPATAVEYVLQACEGLAEAHASGIVHRDLKPANMFLTAAVDGSPLVKILDFGISKEMTGQKIDIHLTRSTDLLGTPFYMSPEQLRDAAEVDARTDIWSMGVILWRMLSGVMPFEGGSFAELCVSIMTGPPPSRGIEHIPTGLLDTLYRCLQKDPARRFENVRQLAGALSHWLNGEESSRVSRISRVLARYGSAAEQTAGGPPPRAVTPTPVPAIGPLEPTADDPAPSLAVTTPLPFASTAAPPRWRRILFIGGIAAGLAMAGVAVVLVLSRNDDSAAAARHADAAPAPPAAVAAQPPVVAQPAPEAAVDAAPAPTLPTTPPRASAHRAVHSKKKPPPAPAKPPPTNLYERRR